MNEWKTPEVWILIKSGNDPNAKLREKMPRTSLLTNFE